MKNPAMGSGVEIKTAESKVKTKVEGSGESRLEIIISYILITGVIVSMAFTVAGLFFYYFRDHLAISLNNPTMFIHGQNFFSFIGRLGSNGADHNKVVFFITVGIVILILTPFIRVIASWLYFGARKDIKYMVITFYVLAVLTLSLLLH